MFKHTWFCFPCLSTLWPVIRPTGFQQDWVMFTSAEKAFWLSHADFLSGPESSQKCCAGTVLVQKPGSPSTTWIWIFWDPSRANPKGSVKWIPYSLVSWKAGPTQLQEWMSFFSVNLGQWNDWWLVRSAKGRVLVEFTVASVRKCGLKKLFPS